MNESLRILRFQNTDLEIGFAPDSGRLCLLRPCWGRGNWIGWESECPSLDVHLASGWLSGTASPRLVKHRMIEDSGGMEITITSALGPLTLSDSYSISGPRIRRRVSLKNHGIEELQVRGLRLAVPGVRIGALENCLLEAPGTAVRPRLPLSLAASQPCGHPPSERFAPGARARWGMAMESAPDCSPGLLGVNNSAQEQALLCWYYGVVEEALPAVGGRGQSVDLVHSSALATWLAPGQSVQAGDQHLLLVSGSWLEALERYRSSCEQIGVTAPSCPAWAAEAGIYEVHAGQFGGFRGLAQELVRIRAMGFDTLYLLPIHRHHNPRGRLWDGNWKANGSPYAILDFESIDPLLGSEEDFRALVAEVHRLGMRLLLDFVPQGCALEARYVDERPEWFCRDEAGGLVSSHGWNDTYSFDWANPEYQQYMLDWSLGLMRAFGFDGFRIDAPLAKEPNWDRRIPYRASATNLGVLNLLIKLRRGLKKIDPEAVLLCELHGPLFARSHDLACDYLPCIQTYQMLQSRLTPAEWTSWIEDHRRCLPKGAQRVCFMETHDTREFHPPAYAWRGSLAQKAGFAALLLAGFIPMIWSGQERGQEEFYRALLRARAASAALLHGEVLFGQVACSDPWVLSILRRSPGQTVWGVISLLPETTTFSFSLPLQILDLAERGRYGLRDLISGQAWSEYGLNAWRGAELRRLALTPRPFQPYFFEFSVV